MVKFGKSSKNKKVKNHQLLFIDPDRIFNNRKVKNTMLYLNSIYIHLYLKSIFTFCFLPSLENTEYYFFIGKPFLAFSAGIEQMGLNLNPLTKPWFTESGNM